MAWAGICVIRTVGGGLLSSQAFGRKNKAASGELHFVRISDNHMGFNKPANPDVAGTMQAAIDKINALPHQPEFIIHTGDLSHASKAAEFDNTKARGWYSFNHRDVHFVGLNNVAAIEGLGKLGADRVQWLEADLKAQPSRPVVVFAHIPLRSVYPEWGWGTEVDGVSATGAGRGEQSRSDEGRGRQTARRSGHRQCGIGRREV